MKHFAKGQSPKSFEDWKNQANDNWQPSYDLLANPEKQDLHQTLLAEQGWVCCYCGRETNVGSSHIEHFRPQHSYEELELQFENLHASCLRQMDPRAPLHCGHAKKNDFDENRFISPLDPSCETRFSFSALGGIIPSDAMDERAIYMIDLLQLNSPVLQALRSEAISMALSPEFLSTMSDDELRLFRDNVAKPDPHGKITSFGHAVARYADQYLPPRQLEAPETPDSIV
ncbi:retron system putative HNH endonuclease [Burkholderia cenocepacia]|uniref:retron system putative HNH endonuclease n=1 Tax=Burkholderia cenocepacia TaxID=95486 RepID=UPI001CF5F515|nr:retron system putative HNH endonuclease [Burkholderia cenocepacia]MCA8082697.1 TIGR02646 family protein [Burkholderia cenocepacia]